MTRAEAAHQLADAARRLCEHQNTTALCDLARAIEVFDATGEAEGWRAIGDFDEIEKRILATDGRKSAVVYLSKWSGNWYFDANQKGCDWRLTHYMPLPSPPTTGEG